jgi:hypothetical protein
VPERSFEIERADIAGKNGPRCHARLEALAAVREDAPYEYRRI